MTNWPAPILLNDAQAEVLSTRDAGTCASVAGVFDLAEAKYLRAWLDKYIRAADERVDGSSGSEGSSQK